MPRRRDGGKGPIDTQRSDPSRWYRCGVLKDFQMLRHRKTPHPTVEGFRDGGSGWVSTEIHTT